MKKILKMVTINNIKQGTFISGLIIIAVAKVIIVVIAIVIIGIWIF